MERNAQLASAGRAGCTFVPLRLARILLSLLLAGTARAQCPADPQLAAHIHQSFEQQDWVQVVSLAIGAPCLRAASNLDYGLALAHLDRWREARNALMAGRRQSRGTAQERFDVELAGVAFEQKRYPEAAAWLRHALKLDPSDEYANNFAGTVYFLMDNMEAALKFWNRVQKPSITALHFDPQLRVRRLLLDRSFVFSPAAVLRLPDLQATQARLNHLGIFPIYHIALRARPESASAPGFDVDFHAVERDGFGNSRAQALISTFGGAFYETIYPSYYNIGRDAANLDSLLRWDSQKYRFWLSYSAPVRAFPQLRWALATDDRDENWTIRRSFTGMAPALGSLNLQRETLSGSFTAVQSGRLSWSLGTELSHRAYRRVADGSAFTPALTPSGFELKQLAGIRFTLIEMPERRLSVTAGAESQAARLWSSPSRAFGSLQGSLLTHWFPQAIGDRYEAQQQLRAGYTFGSAPFDEMFMLGVERDNGLWLRGHIGTRDRQKGSAPLGDSYFLSNSDFFRRLYSNGLFGIQAGPMLDIGWIGAPTSGLSTRQWLVDSGAEARLSLLGVHVVVTYGRDLRAGSNAFFATVAR